MKLLMFVSEISDAVRGPMLTDREIDSEVISMVLLMYTDCYNSVIMFDGCAARYSDPFY
jgi:hypothetical protein